MPSNESAQRIDNPEHEEVKEGEKNSKPAIKVSPRFNLEVVFFSNKSFKDNIFK